MLFHAELLHVTGGYFGVTIFFTLSGFLITSLLLGELRHDSRIDLRAFWRRRVWRILPLLWLVSVVWIVWGIAVGGTFGRQSVAGGVTSFFFGTNWLAAFRHGGAGILNGNWSVSVEEQFYLTWPLVLWFLHRKVSSERRIAVVVVGLATLFFLHRVSLAGAGHDRLWFSTDTQADALLIGCAVALRARCRSTIVSLAGAGVLAAMLFLYVSDTQTLPLAMLVVSVSTALIIPLLQERPGPLAWAPLVAVGRRSYGLYLWGGPIVYLAKHVYFLDTFGMLVSIVLTVAVTEASYRMVELPMRRRGRRNPTPEITKEAATGPVRVAA